MQLAGNKPETDVMQLAIQNLMRLLLVAQREWLDRMIGQLCTCLGNTLLYSPVTLLNRQHQYVVLPMYKHARRYKLSVTEKRTSLRSKAPRAISEEVAVMLPAQEQIVMGL